MKKDKIVLRDNEDKKDLYFNDMTYIGYVYQEVDGFYVYQPNDKGGVFNEYSLRLIADTLKELNKDWNEHIEKYFNESNKY